MKKIIKCKVCCANYRKCHMIQSMKPLTVRVNHTLISRKARQGLKPQAQDSNVNVKPHVKTPARRRTQWRPSKDDVDR